jgi:vancomycin resistance protein YoaR
MGTTKARHLAVFAAAFAASFVAGSLLHFGLERAAHQRRVPRGIVMLGRPLGGLGGPALREAVQGLAPRARSLATRISVRGRILDVRADTLGMELDVDATIQAALSAGREGSIWRQLGGWASRFFRAQVLPIRTRLDVARTNILFDSSERAALGEPAAEGAVGYTDRLVVTRPREGWAIRRSEALPLLTAALSKGEHRERAVIELPVEVKKPTLTMAEVERARAEAEALLRDPIVLKAAGGEKRMSFAVGDLGVALRVRLASAPQPHLDVSLDRDALRRVLERVRPEFTEPARDATFKVGPRNDLTLVPGELGTRLDDEAILDAVMELSHGTERVGELGLRKDVAPALTTEQAAALGIRGLVETFTTYFPCCEARVKNIERIAALVDGHVVKPGEQFSLNSLSGPRTTANGFVGGPTIVEGEMETTVGGGVSQFATTLFNAVFDGGYEIILRQPHTYWFPRYPEGHDATLGYPLPDLVFRNDTEAGVLMKAEVGAKHVKVSLFGDNGGRRVERHVSSRFDVMKPGIELLPDPSLLPGETRVKESGSIGWSLLVSRVVTFPGGEKKEERRKVVYSPRVRRVRTHPCKIPEGDPSYTGEKCPKEEADGGTGK